MKTSAVKLSYQLTLSATSTLTTIHLHSDLPSRTFRLGNHAIYDLHYRSSESLRKMFNLQSRVTCLPDMALTTYVITLALFFNCYVQQWTEQVEWEGGTGHMHSTSYLLEYHRDVHQPRVEVRAKGICLWAWEENSDYKNRLIIKKWWETVTECQGVKCTVHRKLSQSPKLVHHTKHILVSNTHTQANHIFTKPLTLLHSTGS